MLQAFKLKHLAMAAMMVITLPAMAWQPSRTIEVTVPFAPGSGNELVFRTLADRVEKNTGAKFTVMNRPGAAGVIGTEHFVRQPANDHSLLIASILGTTGLDRVQVPDRALSYTLDSFRFVTLVAANPFVIIAHPSDPVSTPEQLIRVLQTERTNFDAGGGSRVVLESIIMHHKLTRGPEGVQHIQHKGPAQTIVAVAGAHVRFAVVPSMVAYPMIESGQIKAVAHSGVGVIKALPNTGSLQKVMPDFSALATWGILLHKDTDRKTVEWYEQEFIKVINSPDTKAFYDKNLLQTIPEALTSNGFEKYARKEEIKQRPIIDILVQELKQKP